MKNVYKALPVVAVLIVLIVFLSMKGVFSLRPKDQLATVDIKNIPLATWEWQPITQMSVERQEQLLDAAQNLNVARLFVDVGDYINGQEEGKKTFDEEKYFQTLSEFITLANERGITVDALTGGPNWAEPGYRYLTFMVLDFVEKYNTAYPNARLAGVQFDIEPYSSSLFDKNKASTLTKYYDLVGDLAAYLKKDGDQNITLGITAPTWYFDPSSDKNIEVRSGSSTIILGDALLEKLNDYGNGYLVLLAYRNHATGDSGTIAKSKKVIEYAQVHTPDVRVYIGQEATEVSPASLSYYGSSFSDLLSNLQQVENAFQGNEAFAGIAIHDFDALMHMKKEGKVIK